MAPVLEYAAWAATFIGIYSIFPSLKISKVIPWVIGLGGLGVLATLVKTYTAFDQAGLSVPSVFAVSMLGSFAVGVYVIVWFFRTKRPERY